MSLKIRIRFLTENTDHEIRANPDLTVLQFKEVLRQQIPLLRQFPSIPTEVLKLSLEGFDEGTDKLAKNLMEDAQLLKNYPLAEERHSVLLALERPLEKVACRQCNCPFLQWSSDRLSRGDMDEAKDQETMEAMKTRIPQLLNCGHSICLGCLREGLVMEEEAMAEEKELMPTDPVFLSKKAVDEQNRVATEKKIENVRRKRERQKAENMWKFVCPIEGCGVISYWRRDQEWQSHEGMQRLVHLKKREWVEAEKARGRCFFQTCGSEPVFRCQECQNIRFCVTHYQRVHQHDDAADHHPVLLHSDPTPAPGDILHTRFCCYCGGGESDSCHGERERAHCDHRDSSMISSRKLTNTVAVRQLGTLGELQKKCCGRLVEWNGVMDRLQEHRVNGVEKLRREFDELIERLETKREEMVAELSQCYREKELEVLEKMAALGKLSGEVEAGATHYRQSLNCGTNQTRVFEGSSNEIVVRDIADIDALTALVSQLTSEPTEKSSPRFSEISTISQTEILRLIASTEADNSKMKPPVHHSNTGQAFSSNQRNPKTDSVQPKSQPVKMQFSATVASHKPPGAKEASGKSLLQAVENGSMEDLKLLIQNGVDVNYKGESGWTPLHKAASKGQLAAVILLCQHGADVHCRTNVDVTPLHLATEGGHQEMVEYLLRQGADKAAKDWNGFTPFDCIGAGNKNVKRCLKKLLAVNSKAQS